MFSVDPESSIKYEDREIDPSRIPVEGEPDFYETNCHWKDCNKEFDTQDELVRVRV